RCRSRRGSCSRRRRSPWLRGILLGSPVAENGGADADIGRALLDGDLVVLARSHRQLAQAVRAPELAKATEVRSGRFRIGSERRHRHQSTYVRIEIEKG